MFLSGLFLKKNIETKDGCKLVKVINDKKSHWPQISASKLLGE